MPKRGMLRPEACLTVEAALAALADIAARPAFGQADALKPDDVLAYALALMQLRDSAHAAGRTRLTLACDALSVTVARLLERCAETHCGQCSALKQFVVHAQAMLHLSSELAEQARAH